MSSLKLYGSTSGYVEIVPEATAGNNSVTLPSGSGTLVTQDGSGNITITGRASVPLGSASSPSIYFDDNTGIYSPGADQLAITTGGTGRLFIDASGKIGAGAASTGAYLRVLGLTGASIIEAAGVDTDGFADVEIKSTGTSGASRLYFSDTAAQSGLIRYSHDTNSMEFSTAGSERARIDTSGRLLVGTSSARSNLFGSVSPVFQIEGANSSTTRSTLLTYGANSNEGPLLNFAKHNSNSIGGQTSVASGNELGQIVFTGSDGTNFVQGASIKSEVDGTPGANDMPGRLVFSTTADGASSPTERMRISAAGDVTINDTSSDAKLVVANGSERQVSFKINNTNASPVGLQIRYGTDVNAAANRFIDCIGNATTRFLVFSNGNVQNTNNSYGQISDIKLKENIVDANSQWNDLKALRVRNFNFKDETGQQTHRQIGLIAQEVENVSPGIVFESPDLDADGNDLGTFTKGVAYSVLYMKAVKALQEAMERIEVLEAKVNALEGN